MPKAAATSHLQALLDRENAATWPTKHDGHEVIIVRTRTGKKLHLGPVGSSVTNCGVWLKANGVHFRIKVEAVTHEHILCERCFGAAPLSASEGR